MAISHKPGTVFNSPETQQWAVHRQPTRTTSVSLFGTEFLTHFLSYKHQSRIYSINYHINTPIQSPTATDCPRMSKNLHNSVPCFGTDQPPIPGIFSYQACILNAKFQELKTQTAHKFSGQSQPLEKISRKFQQFGPMFWDRSNGPSRPQTNQNMEKPLKMGIKRK